MKKINVPQKVVQMMTVILKLTDTENTARSTLR